MSSNSVEHTPVDPRMVLHHLTMLEKQLEGLESAEDDMNHLMKSMMGHVDALKVICNRIKKPVCVSQVLLGIISDCMLAFRKSAFQC